MHIRFADVDEKFMKDQVHDGYYSNETELIRDAVRRMREGDEKKKRFYGAVLLGDEAIERGETVTLTPKLIENIKKSAIAKAKKNKAFNNTDALPEISKS